MIAYALKNASRMPQLGTPIADCTDHNVIGVVDVSHDTQNLFSAKGTKLIELYSQMVAEGYDTRSGDRIKSTYNDFELVKFKNVVCEHFKAYEVKSVLDYGCGGSDWENQKIFNGKSAIDYFGLTKAFRYEPARNLDERQAADAVICFDVMEHVFISDAPNVLRDILSYASKLAVINVACYPANALLPNGENAHITQRPPHWWKGLVDAVSIEFPHVSVSLFCSTAYNKAEAFPIFCDAVRQADPCFEIRY